MKFIYIQSALLALCIVIVASLMLNENPWYHWVWFIACGLFVCSLEANFKK